MELSRNWKSQIVISNRGRSKWGLRLVREPLLRGRIWGGSGRRCCALARHGMERGWVGKADVAAAMRLPYLRGRIGAGVEGSFKLCFSSFAPRQIEQARLRSVWRRLSDLFRKCAWNGVGGGAGIGRIGPIGIGLLCRPQNFKKI